MRFFRGTVCSRDVAPGDCVLVVTLRDLVRSTRATSEMMMRMKQALIAVAVSVLLVAACNGSATSSDQGGKRLVIDNLTTLVSRAPLVVLVEASSTTHTVNLKSKAFEDQLEVLDVEVSVQEVIDNATTEAIAPGSSIQIAQVPGTWDGKDIHLKGKRTYVLFLVPVEFGGQVVPNTYYTVNVLTGIFEVTGRGADATARGLDSDFPGVSKEMTLDDVRASVKAARQSASASTSIVPPTGGK